MSGHPPSDPRPSRKKLRKWLEVFQPSKDSWAEPPFSAVAQVLTQDPELQKEWQRIESQDRQIRSIIAETPVPKGLLERTLARLASAEREVSSASTIDASRDVLISHPSPSILGAKWNELHPREEASPHWAKVETGWARKASSRDLPLSFTGEKRFANGQRAALASFLTRGLLGSLLAVSLIFCLLWPFVQLSLWHRQSGWTSSALLERAIVHFRSDRSYYATGRLVAQEPPPSGFRPSCRVYGWQVSRWRSTDLLPARTTIAFDLPPVRGISATLYVTDVPISGLPDLPPSSPSLNTGMCSAGIWQENGRVLILVVAGGPDAYRQFLLDAGRELA